MYYIVSERTQQILETEDTYSEPDIQAYADYYGEPVYAIKGEHSGLSAEPCGYKFSQ